MQNQQLIINCCLLQHRYKQRKKYRRDFFSIVNLSDIDELVGAAERG